MRFRIYHVLCLLLGTISCITADTIDGVYVNNQAKLKLIVESTPDGIRTRRLDQEQWFTYEQIRPRQYRDAKGNMYYILEDDQIEWEGSDGIKRIRFKKSEALDDDLPNKTSRENKKSVTSSQQSQSIKRQFVNARSLRGKWINRSTGQMIEIKSYQPSVMKVRSTRSGWTEFERSLSDTFMDRRKNQYIFVDGRLTYTSRSGDFLMEFERI